VVYYVNSWGPCSCWLLALPRGLHRGPRRSRSWCSRLGPPDTQLKTLQGLRSAICDSSRVARAGECPYLVTITLAPEHEGRHWPAHSRAGRAGSLVLALVHLSTLCSTSALIRRATTTIGCVPWAVVWAVTSVPVSCIEAEDIASAGRSDWHLRGSAAPWHLSSGPLSSRGQRVSAGCVSPSRPFLQCWASHALPDFNGPVASTVRVVLSVYQLYLMCGVARLCQLLPVALGLHPRGLGIGLGHSVLTVLSLQACVISSLCVFSVTRAVVVQPDTAWAVKQ